MFHYKDKVVQRRLYTAINVINVIALLAGIALMIASAETIQNSELIPGLGHFRVGKEFSDFTFDWWIMVSAGAFIWGVVWGFLTIFFVKQKDDTFRYTNWGVLTTSILTIVICGCNFILILSGILGILLYVYRIKNHIGTKTTEVLNATTDEDED